MVCVVVGRSKEWQRMRNRWERRERDRGWENFRERVKERDKVKERHREGEREREMKWDGRLHRVRVGESNCGREVGRQEGRDSMTGVAGNMSEIFAKKDQY